MLDVAGPRLAAPRGRLTGVTAEPARVELVVPGRVQGVGFRYFVLREAMALGARGLGRERRADGSVRCVAEGPRDRIEAFLAIAAGRSAGGARERRQRALDARRPATLGPFAVRSGAHQGD